MDQFELQFTYNIHVQTIHIYIEETLWAKKLNTLTLSGLIIGPILGSGIVLLPPLAYEMMGHNQYTLGSLLWP